MRYRINNLLGLGLLVGSLFIGTQSSALAEMDNTQPTELAYHSIQVIEGDKVRTVAPLPPLPTTASQSDSLRMAPAAATYPAMSVTALVARSNRNLDPFQVQQIARTIHVLSHNYGLDPRLFASLVAVESSFRPDAVSRSGAIGLGQLKPDTARWLGVNDPFDPIQNLVGVAKYLRYLLDRYNGSAAHALAAYFQGQGTIDRKGIDENARVYISKVSRILARTY